MNEGLHFVVERSILIVEWRKNGRKPLSSDRLSGEDGSASSWSCSSPASSATAYPKAKGIWRDEERSGALVKDEPVVVHCYTTPMDIQDARNLAELGEFCRTMGREAHQGEIGLVIDDEYCAIHDFTEE